MLLGVRAGFKFKPAPMLLCRDACCGASSAGSHTVFLLRARPEVLCRARSAWDQDSVDLYRAQSVPYRHRSSSTSGGSERYPRLVGEVASLRRRPRQSAYGSVVVLEWGDERPAWEIPVNHSRRRAWADACFDPMPSWKISMRSPNGPFEF